MEKEILTDLTTEEYLNGIDEAESIILKSASKEEYDKGDIATRPESHSSDMEMKEMLTDLTTEEYLNGIDEAESTILSSEESNHTFRK